MVITIFARSLQLAAAARLMAISWAYSLQLWMIVDGPARMFAYGAVDALLAAAFYHMSRKRWFPVPLFFLHAALAIYDLYAVLAGPSVFWVQMFLNRTFEMELIYIIACAVYRIMVLNGTSHQS